jgi:hypothetical protein
VQIARKIDTIVQKIKVHNNQNVLVHALNNYYPPIEHDLYNSLFDYVIDMVEMVVVVMEEKMNLYSKDSSLMV